MLTDLFQYIFFTNALEASLLISILCGLAGTWIVARRLVFIAGGITHASFGGIGLGYFLGLNPLIGAAVFAVASANGMLFATRKGNLREDSAIGILWSLGMALGVLFIFLTPGYAPNLMTYLFGSLLTVGSAELNLMWLLAGVVVVFFALFYRVILTIAFDESHARTMRLPVDVVNYALMTLIALVIVLSIRVSGIILVISFLTIPQSTANLFARSFKQIMYASVGISLLTSVGGLYLSYWLNVPSGATIIVVMVVVFLIARLFAGLGKLRKSGEKKTAAL